jgi:4-diphosphocytidyl-2-C-methyl-D-erythritol kinase
MFFPLLLFAAISSAKGADMTSPASAELCGRCHRGIHEAWKTSSHAQAMESRLFQEALALAEARPAGLGAEIVLTKHIPVAAGLGGGSADAAATLIALNELWACGLDDDALQGVGSLVGSDVPAMLAGRPVLAQGRGVKLETVDAPTMWWAIVPFDFPVRTPDAYRWWDEDGAEAPTGPDPANVIEAAAAGDVDALAASMFNDLEAAVFSRHPVVAEAKQTLLDAGAVWAIMCGSGPTVAGLAADEKAAKALAAEVPGAIVASSLG